MAVNGRAIVFWLKLAPITATISKVIEGCKEDEPDQKIIALDLSFARIQFDSDSAEKVSFCVGTYGTY